MSEKIIEKLEFLTQIHKSWDGTEQRMALRNEPRRYISYDYLGMKTWHSQYLRMLTFGQQTQLIEFPLWHAKSELKDIAYKGQAMAKIEPEALWGYRNIGAFELWTSDKVGGLKYDLKYLSASGVLGMTKQLTSDWPAAITTVIPVCLGVLQQEDKYVNLHSDLTSMMINLELLQNQKAPLFPPGVDEFHDEIIKRDAISRGLPEFYLGVEVFRHEPPWEEDMSSSSSRNVNRLDNETGIFLFDLKNEETTESKDITYIGFSRTEIYNLQRFFYRIKGRLKSFYMPSWVNDMELAEDAPAGQIYILTKFNLYWKHYAKSRRRKMIVVFYRNESCEILKIAGYSTDETGQYGKVYLENALKRGINKNAIRMISYFYRCRLASDTLTVDYETTEAARITLTFQEVDE